jgi:anti-sigma regulatory factor (Ser/Thr protein kinase)
MKLKWLILFLLLPVISKSQRQRIDSLATILPSLKDSSRIDCLNKLALEYYKNALPETYINVHTDSAVMFATLAHSEAEKINYTRGIADALQNLGEIARDRNDFLTAEKYLRQSVLLFEKLKLTERYSWANLTLGWSLQQQWKYSEARATYERAMPFCIATDNKERQSMLLRLISYTYSSPGYNEKAFEYMLKAIRLTYIVKDERGVISSPQNMANIYKYAGDKETALAYFKLAAQNAKPINPVRYNRLLGDIAALLNRPDSASYYYNKADNIVSSITNDSSIGKRLASYRYVGLGDSYLRQKKYEPAIKNFKRPLPFFEKGNEKTSLMRICSGLAKCYQGQGNFSMALTYAKRLLQAAQQTGTRPFERDADELYWKIYESQGKTDSAYKYSLKYTALKDSIMNDEYRRNIAVAEMKSQDEQQKAKIDLLQKDQQLSKEKLSLQQREIKNESLLRNVLAGSIIFFILATVVIFRYIFLRRKNERQRLEQELQMQQLQAEKNKIEFQQQAAELEMQALRAQMNPHFIFNCLSSINRFILISKTDEASDYLTKFSRLIRMSLHNSEKSLITLESELEALRLYLDLERLRFKNAFNYSITFVNAIDVNTLYIPPMLIQPFAENAIWHGLMHKKAVGCLEIELCAQDKTLTCIITDNGIGRKMAASLNSRSAEKNKSMGVEITAGRLALLNRSKNETAVLNIEDLKDEEGNGCGTKVILTMPYKDLTEVVA